MKRPIPKSPSDLSLALTAARDAVGDAAAVQRVRTGLLTKLATGAAPPAAAGAAAPATTASATTAPATTSVAGAWLGKGMGALLLVAAAGAAVYNHNDASPRPKAASAPRDDQPPSAADATRYGLTPSAAGATRDGLTPSAAGARRDSLAPAAASATNKGSLRTAESTRLAAPAAFVGAPASASEPAPAKHAPAAKTTARVTASAKRSAAPQPLAAVAQAPCSDAVAEVDLLSRAQQALRSQPQLALSLLTEHAQRFSCGVLALERDSLRIDAERALGLDARATEHARELVTRYPESLETRALKQRLDAANSGSERKTQPVDTPTP